MLYKVPISKILAMKAKSNTELKLVEEQIKANKLKRVDRRLQVIKLHLEGKKQSEIADKLDYTPAWVCKLLKEYREKGLCEFARHKYGGNHRAMSVEEEAKLLSQFEEESKSGKLVVANTIKKAFDEKRGKDTGRGYIYMLLKRHEARKVMPRSRHPQKASDEVIDAEKKRINIRYWELINNLFVKNHYKRVRLMFQDEAIFGRIGKLYRCWAWNGFRPTVIQQKIREYRYLYGAVEPLTGESCFRIFSHCDTVCMNVYMKELSVQFKDDYILLVCDNAVWHKSKGLFIPDNVEIIHIPPYTPEMNPIEQIWDEIREKHFANRTFNSLEQAVDQLCKAVQTLQVDTIISITLRIWMFEQFN